MFCSDLWDSWRTRISKIATTPSEYSVSLYKVTIFMIFTRLDQVLLSTCETPKDLLLWVVVLVFVFARSICMSLRRSFPKTRRSNTTYSTRESRPSTRERDRRGTFYLRRVEEWPFAMRKGWLFARRRRSCRLVWSWLRRYWRERRFLEYVWRNVYRLRVMSREQWYVRRAIIPNSFEIHWRREANHIQLGQFGRGQYRLFREHWWT